MEPFVKAINEVSVYQVNDQELSCSKRLLQFERYFLKLVYAFNEDDTASKVVPDEVTWED